MERAPTNQTDSRAPKCLPRVTKTVMYIVNMYMALYTGEMYFLTQLQYTLKCICNVAYAF
jgi:hypothetical protein